MNLYLNGYGSQFVLTLIRWGLFMVVLNTCFSNRFYHCNNDTFYKCYHLLEWKYLCVTLFNRNSFCEQLQIAFVDPFKTNVFGWFSFTKKTCVLGFWGWGTLGGKIQVPIEEILIKCWIKSFSRIIFRRTKKHGHHLTMKLENGLFQWIFALVLKITCFQWDKRNNANSHVI